jgi:protocatechuate 3,4-dioxygenase beta subunit
MRRAILLWMIPLAVCAQETRCIVEGMVVNGATGEPLRRAVVNIRRTDVARNYTGQTVFSAATDSEGKYLFADVEPGTYLLVAERSGFAPAKYTNSIKLERGQKSSGLLIMMTPHAVISGRVLDDYGEPVIGADVQVSGLSYEIGRKQLTRAGGGATNDLGEYRVYGLPAGKYYVNATYRSNTAQPGGEEYATTYYPHTADAGAAVPVQVGAGVQLRNVDITLTKVRTVSVRGRATCDIPGEKRSIMVNLYPRFSLGIATPNLMGRMTSVRPDGTFETSRVVPGAYTLTATANIDDKRYSSRVTIQVGGTDVEGVSVTVQAAGSVSGRVRVEGKPDETLTGVSVGLRPWESGGVIFGSQPIAKVEADGNFQIADVSVDRYQVYVTGLPQGYYVKSIRSGGSEVQWTGYEAAGGSATLQILLSPQAGSIEGTVMDGKTQKPAPGATVVLVPEMRDRTQLYSQATSDNEGHFRLKSLVPGEYRLFAWEEVPSYAWMDPDYMRDTERKGQLVTVAEGSPQTLQVTMIAR